MVNRGVFAAVGRQIGVGKESGMFLNCANVFELLLLAYICIYASTYHMMAFVPLILLKTYLRLRLRMAQYWQ